MVRCRRRATACTDRARCELRCIVCTCVVSRPACLVVPARRRPRAKRALGELRCAPSPATHRRCIGLRPCSRLAQFTGLIIGIQCRRRSLSNLLSRHAGGSADRPRLVGYRNATAVTCAFRYSSSASPSVVPPENSPGPRRCLR
jgi:hypothetical protein